MKLLHLGIGGEERGGEATGLRGTEERRHEIVGHGAGLQAVRVGRAAADNDGHTHAERQHDGE